MTSVDKYVLIPFTKYQKLLKGTYTKEPLNIANPPKTDDYITSIPPSLSYPKIGGKDTSDSRSNIKEASEASNDVNTDSRRKTNIHPPPGIPSGEIKININPLSNKSLSDKGGWLSNWEEL